MAHVIKQQYLHVEVNGTESDGVALQRRLPDFCEYRLTPAIEKALDRCMPADGHIYIERLEIDAGTLELERLEHDLAEFITPALEKVIMERIISSDGTSVTADRTLIKPETVQQIRFKTTQQTIDEAFIYFLQTGSLPWSFRLPAGRSLEEVVLDAWRETTKSPTELRIVNDDVLHTLTTSTARKRVVRQFSFDFLRVLLSRFSPDATKIVDEILPALRGVDTPSIEVKEFERQLWETVFEAVSKGNAVTTTGIISETWCALSLPSLATASARKRMIRQIPPVFLRAMLSRLSVEAAKAVDEILPALRKVDMPSLKVEEFERQLWETAFESVSKGTVVTATGIVGETWRALSVPVAERIMLAKLLEYHWPGATGILRAGRSVNTEPIPPQIHESGSAITNAADRIEKSEHSPADVDDRLEKSEQSPTNTNDRLEKLEQSPVDVDDRLEKLEQSPADVDDRLEKLEQSPADLGDHPEITEGIYIDCAGLVLLHPFLPQFFEALGIAVEDKILQPDRALCLLHFLATGQPVAPEYELILPKILCGAPLEMPVESNVELTGAELEEAAALLDAVIRHWEALRNTSADGLRGAFLVRPGKVSLGDDGDWRLQVESKSYDILLDQLPWGIGMIKLPWMSRMLWVEWR